MIQAIVKYDEQDQQGKAAFNECNPNTTQQQEPKLSKKQRRVMK
jgi:hypothetical protein